jgi:hypothetical protein
MVFPPEPGSFVTAEGGMGRIGVIAIGPHSPGLDAAPYPVRVVAVARPDAGAKTLDGVIADADRILDGLERRHRQHRPENLLLEDPHAVVAAEHCRDDW